jgi:hypothetical protein
MWPDGNEPLWHSLRKGGTNIHAQWMKHAYSNNLFAEDASICTDNGLELRLDLDKNLSKQNRSSDQRHDAEQLLEHIRDLTCVQLTDHQILDRIEHHIGIMDRDSGTIPDVWGLTVRLGGEHRFLVTPEYKKPSLFLRIKEML